MDFTSNTVTTMNMQVSVEIKLRFNVNKQTLAYGHDL